MAARTAAATAATATGTGTLQERPRAVKFFFLNFILIGADSQGIPSLSAYD